MRVAIISDIHANIFALEAVFASIKQHGVDLIINLGDILYGPISPLETFLFLQDNDCHTIKGNQDDDIVAATPLDTNPTMAWVIEQLPSHAVSWLKQLPDELQFDDLYVCHGKPGNNCAYFLEDVSTGQARVLSNDNIQSQLGGVIHPVIACGHSHLARAVWLETGQLVINPGSVGLPAYHDNLPVNHVMESFSPHARYCILDKTPTGWQVSQQLIPYPHQTAAKLARKLGRPDWTYALMTGRAIIS